MNQQMEYFKQAELALAAYGNFASNIPTLRELEAADFSPSQARAFADTYRVIDQEGDVTGLSATIFANDATGETFPAIRGTEINDSGDLFAGLLLAMFGSTVLQPQYASLKAQVQVW